MTLFYSGTLQEGIALAVQEAKAVVCFARDDTELSSTWEDDYFSDSEIAQALHDKAITLRLSSGTQEAGFLTSFCPISSYPTVVVIKNGTLQEFITSEVSKEDFLNRLKVALEGKYAPPVAQQPQTSAPSTSNDITTPSSIPPATASSPPPIPPQQPVSQPTTRPSRPQPQPQSEQSSSSSKRLPRKEEKAEKPKSKQEKPRQEPKPRTPAKPAATKTTKQPKEEPKPQPAVPKGPPKEYRLQVRLFDGSSVRSTFTPKQTIGKEVRSWLDQQQQMTNENRPYNLKHILTPLPSRTLSVGEESQTLEELGLGSTANLVMVPVQSFTSAYSAAGSSLPVRGISAVYNTAYSVASTTASFFGSFVGYGQNPPPPPSEPEPSSSSTPAPNSSRNRRPSGPNIRTLHDQPSDGRDSQFYNGNQLNFEPRNQDGNSR